MTPRTPIFNHDLADDIDRVLVDRHALDIRVSELAGEIARCYHKQELTIVGVLTGSLVFLADLIRRLPLRVKLSVISISSYPGRATTSRGPSITGLPPESLAGKHVLIVDDILDSGKTLLALKTQLAAHHPASLRTCVILRKQIPDFTPCTQADFAGFDVPNEFVVGYGLDYDNLYRNLPDICVLKPHCYDRQMGKT